MEVESNKVKKNNKLTVLKKIILGVLVLIFCCISFVYYHLHFAQIVGSSGDRVLTEKESQERNKMFSY